MISNVISLPAAKAEEVYGMLRIVREESNGRAFLKIWRGKAERPFANFYFRTIEAREIYVAEQKHRQDSREKLMADRRAARLAFRHTLKVGDILFSSWGYEQTNVDFYQVIARTDKTVVIREIASKGMSADGNMGGTVVAVKDSFIGEPRRCVVSQGNTLSLSTFECASPWDGQPKHFSSYH